MLDGSASERARRRGVEDVEEPSSARVYDYLLGGAAHTAADRAIGDELASAEPLVVSMVRENRSFLRRATTFLARAGVEQFLDLGSGIPAMRAVHEVVRAVRPGAAVAYVDRDPVAVARGEHLLTAVDGVDIHGGDLRDVDGVLADAFRERASGPGLDPTRPVGLLMFSVLGYVDDPEPLVADYLARLAPGSALALSHPSGDDPRIDLAAIERITGGYPTGPLRARSYGEVATLFGGVELVEPGVVWASRWRPDEVERPGHERACGHWAGVGFRP